MNAPLPYTIPQLRQMGLSQPEINKVIYNRRGFRHPLIQPNGDLTTIRAVGIQTPDGRQVSVPSYIHTGAGGQVVNDPRKLYRIWKSSIDAGRWPTYDSVGALNARDQYIDNTVMNRDANYWIATHPAVRR